MHIESLKVFCDVIDAQSFSAAAARNSITQSAVSQQIRALEKRFGRRLIERARGRASLTPAGQVLYDASKEIVSRFEGLDQRLQELEHVVGGSLRVTTVQSVGLYEMAEPLRRYLRAHPNVTVQLDYRRSREIHEGLIEGRIDLGIVAFPVAGAQLEALPFREDRMVLISPPDHPFAARKQVSIQRLNGEAFIGFEIDIPTRRAIDALLREHGVDVRYVAEVDNVDTIKRLVEVGQGVAIAPEPAVRGEVKAGTLSMTRVSDAAMTRSLGILHRKNSELSLAAQRFIEYLTSPKKRGTEGHK